MASFVPSTAFPSVYFVITKAYSTFSATTWAALEAAYAALWATLEAVPEIECAIFEAVSTTEWAMFVVFSARVGLCVFDCWVARSGWVLLADCDDMFIINNSVLLWIYSWYLVLYFKIGWKRRGWWWLVWIEMLCLVVLHVYENDEELILCMNMGRLWVWRMYLMLVYLKKYFNLLQFFQILGIDLWLKSRCHQCFCFILEEVCV